MTGLARHSGGSGGEYFYADVMKQGLIKPLRNGIQATCMGFIHALEPVRDAGSWTFRGGCGGIGRRAALRSLWANNPWKFESSQPHQQHVVHKRYPMFDMLNMCVNEARIATCIFNYTRTDRETQKNLQDYLWVVGGCLACVSYFSSNPVRTCHHTRSVIDCMWSMHNRNTS